MGNKNKSWEKMIWETINSGACLGVSNKQQNCKVLGCYQKMLIIK